MVRDPTAPRLKGRAGLLCAFAQLIRLPVGILAALAGVATLFALNPAASVSQYGLTAAVLACMYAAACAINDYWDLDQDRINHPERPLPSGQLSPRQAWWTAVFLFATALIAAMPLGLSTFLLVAGCTILLWCYSHLLLVSGILGNWIVAAIVATLIFFGSLVAGQPLAMLYPTGFLFGYTLVKEIVWDIHDAAGDRARGIVTLANRWGTSTAFAVAWVLLGVLLASIPIALWLLPMTHPRLFAGLALAMLLSLGGALARYQRCPSPEIYRQFIRWERLSMLLGVLGLLGAAPTSH